MIRMCDINPIYFNLGEHIIEIPSFDSDAPEDCIIFIDVVQKALVGQNGTIGSPIYK